MGTLLKRAWAPAGNVGSKEGTMNTKFSSEFIIGGIHQPGEAIPKGLQG